MRTLDFDIERMIHLRTVEELSYSAIGRALGKDHTTIMYHCKRLQISPPETVRVFHQQSAQLIRTLKTVHVEARPVLRHKYADLLEEKMLPPRSYTSYLREALQRPVEKRYYKTYYQTPLTPDEARRLRTHGAIA